MGAPTCVHTVTGVAALGWPVKEMEFMGTTYFFPDLHADDQAVQWLVVLKLEDWEMQPIAWHSPAHLKVASHWQGGSFPCAAAKSGDPVPLVVGAARDAFFKLSQAPLQQLASILGVHIREGSNLFDIVCQLCKHVLGVGEACLVPILGKRMLKPLDDTIEVFDDEEFRANIDASDLKELDKFKTDWKVGKKSMKTFEENFGRLCRKHRASSTGPSSSSTAISFSTPV